MAYFVVVCERGSAWDWSLPMRRQQGWQPHAAFMDGLVAEGFVVAGGPLGDEDHARRVLHVVVGPDARAVRTRLGADPWVWDGLLRTVSVEPWTVLLGGFRG